MKIHSVNGSHIIEKSGKRPFKAMIGDRVRSFGSLDSAAKAQAKSLKQHQEQAVIEMESWRDNAS